MDTTRFYSPSVLKEAYPNWSPSQYFQAAETLTLRCIRHYGEHEGTHRRHYYGTLYAGSLGPLVFMRYQLAKHLLETDSEKAKGLFQNALAVAEGAIREEEEPHNSRRRYYRVTLLESTWVGAKVLQCAILYQLNRSSEARENVDKILQFLKEACLSLPPQECEVLYGRAGAMQAVLFLRQELQDYSIGRDLVVSLASDVLRAGLACSQAMRSNLELLWEWHGTSYLGAAHGVVGILQTLLSLQSDELDAVNQQLNVNVRSMIQQTIDGLDELCFPSGNLASSIGSSRDKLVHWCHGAPGHVMLLTRALASFQSTTYLERAKFIGDDVLLQRGLLKKGVGLCHGISGNAYALLSIARATNDDRWIENAKSFAHFAWNHFSELESIPDHPYSLFEGCAGFAMLLLDLCNPGASAFPLYEFI